jgi:hypothetical protein
MFPRLAEPDRPICTSGVGVRPGPWPLPGPGPAAGLVLRPDPGVRVARGLDHLAPGKRERQRGVEVGAGARLIGASRYTRQAIRFRFANSVPSQPSSAVSSALCKQHLDAS